MPRLLKFPADGIPVLVQPGTYTYEVNGFNSNNCDSLQIIFARVNWPLTPSDTVVTGAITWNTGGGAVFTLGGGEPLDRNGVVSIRSVVSVAVPNTATGKKPVNSGTAVVTIHAALITAVTVEAI